MKAEIIDDAVTLVAGGTYTGLGHMRNTLNGQVTTEIIADSGTWVQSGQSVTFKSKDGSSTAGTLNGSSITMVEAGLTAVYTK